MVLNKTVFIIILIMIESYIIYIIIIDKVQIKNVCILFYNIYK